MRLYRKTIILAALLCFALPSALHADDAKDVLPPALQAHVGAPLSKVGSGTYHRFGFRVYVASLWAKDGKWNPDKPYALLLRYTRSVSKDTIVDTVTDDIRDQNIADDATLTRWQGVLNQDLPAVEDGDTLVGLCQPGKHSLLFYNGKQIASIDDAALSKAFFNIWLGQTADEDMRASLLGQSR